MKDARIDKAIRRTLAVQGGGSSTHCPDDSRIAAYLDQRLGPDECAEFEMHAAQCVSCRQVLALSMKLDEDSAAAAGALPGGERKQIFRLVIPVSAIALVLVASLAGVLYYQLFRNTHGKPDSIQTAEMQKARPAQPAGSTLAIKEPESGTGGDHARMESYRAISKPSDHKEMAAAARSDAAFSPSPITEEARNVRRAEEAKEIERAALEAEAAKGKFEAAADRVEPLVAAAPSAPRAQATAALPAVSVAAREETVNALGKTREKQIAAADEAVEQRPSSESARKAGAFASLAASGRSIISPREAIRQLANRTDQVEASRKAKVGSRSFVLDAGYWIDRESLGQSEVEIVEIEKGSKEFEAIKRTVEGIDRLVTPTTAVMIFWEGKNYLVRY